MKALFGCRCSAKIDIIMTEKQSQTCDCSVSYTHLCRKYSSVLIGKTHEEFLDKLETAMKLRDDPDYIALLEREAKANDWSEKAAAIINMLREDER